jgi:hypothetical protein
MESQVFTSNTPLKLSGENMAGWIEIETDGPYKSWQVKDQGTQPGALLNQSE